MSEKSERSKRLAKNTLLLYARMILLMFVNLYASRVILNNLGVNDYGIYNVVGGVVTMFSMLSGSLTAAISRFITFDIGKGDMEKLKKTFSASVTIQLGLAFIVVVVAETIGLWFLNEKLVIPEDRIAAANFCYQFSIMTFVVNLISVPYNSAIIAHEKMSAFAYISILEAIGKLSIALTIAICPIDKLIFYGLMIAILAVLIRFIYGHYCKKHFVECTYHFLWDKDLLAKMFGFAGWNFIGSSASILRDQGGNLLINIFFGPAVNAARAIAVQVNGVITGFTQNFMTALNPQITKSYASGEKEYFIKLLNQGSRFSFYMLLLICLPVLLNTNYILELWLKQVPDHTVLFVQLTLILALHECLTTPLVVAMLATGDIKKYQIFAGGLNLLNLPVAYVGLLLGLPPESVVIVSMVFSILVQVVRLYMLKIMIDFDIMMFLKKVYLNIIVVSLWSFVIPWYVSGFIGEGFIRFMIVSSLAVFCTVFSEFFFGCSKEEKVFVMNKIKIILKKCQ